MPRPRDGYLRVVGRLREGVTMEQARAQLEAIKASTAAAEGLPRRDGWWQPVLASLLDTLVGDRKESMLLVLWAVGLLMLVASTSRTFCCHDRPSAPGNWLCADPSVHRRGT